ncbi:MAG: iron chelate uptake ABC transporter family permease subunit [Actinomycetota bacterium]
MKSESSILVVRYFSLIGKHSVDATTVWQIRFPRALGAVIIGAGLGIAGAIAQGIFRNPLAEPTLIGLSSGATLWNDCTYCIRCFCLWHSIKY